MHKEFARPTLRTLNFFDLFDYPLTREELFRLLWCPGREDFNTYASELEELSRAGQIGEKFGYYFLPGKEDTVAQRRERLHAVEEKYKRARRAARLIKSVPFLRALFICNSVGFGHARPDSDIDFFIITEPNRIWIVRFFTNLILRLCGWRTYVERRASRICLSFFIDARHLNFASWRVAPDDVYLAYWMAHLIPLYDPKNYLQSLLSANRWLSEYLPNLGRAITERPPLIAPSRLGKLWQKSWEKMWQGGYGDLVEAQARGLQEQKMKLSVQDLAKRGGKEVIIADGIIKLHENDRRREYYESWRAADNYL